MAENDDFLDLCSFFDRRTAIALIFDILFLLALLWISAQVKFFGLTFLLYWTKLSVGYGFKSKENLQKPRFPAYFRHFRHQCAKFHEKYKVQLEKFKKYRFPAKIGCFGDFYRVPASKISFIDNLTVGIVIGNVFA